MAPNNRYILEKIYATTNLPVFIFDDKNDLVSMIGEVEDSDIKYSSEYGFFMDLLRKLSKVSQPFVEVKDNVFVYFAFQDDLNFRYIVGPHLLEADIDPHLYVEEEKTTRQISRIIYKTCEKLMNDFYVFYWCVTQREISSSDILGVDKVIMSENGNIEKEINEYRLQKNEQDLKRLSYEFENNYMLAIEYGRAENLSKMTKASDLSDSIGILANNSLKQTEYMIASSIVLVSRAAIRGGVTPTVAYEMSELYFKKLEKCMNKIEMIKLNESMRNKFSDMVKKVRSDKRNMGYVEQCKEFIHQNVYSQLRVEEIAKVIGINNNYLSRKFAEQEGMTISQFIVKTRLSVAQDLIKHSKMGISQISEYLCFASQSHFGKLFKAEFGVSPLQYKKQHMVIEVDKKS